MLNKKINFDSIPTYLDKWRENMLAGSKDRPAITDSELRDLVVNMYNVAGLSAPDVIRLPSPFALRGFLDQMSDLEKGSTAFDTLQKNVKCLSRIDGKLPDEDWLKLVSEMWKPLNDLRNNLGRNVRDSVFSEETAKSYVFLHKDKFKDLNASFYAKYRINPYTEETDKSFVPPRGIFWGHFDSDWASWCEFADQELGIEKLSKTASTRKLIQSFSYIVPFDNVCFVCDAPTKIDFDDQFNLHCEDGPAVTWADGYSIYSVSGFLIPAEVMEKPETNTQERIKEERNVETRRLMIRYYVGGVGKYLEDIGAKVLDSDSVSTDVQDKNAPALLRALFQAGSDRFLVGTDGSTNRTYFMPVPENVKTCKEAHRSIMPLGLVDDDLIGQS